MKIVVTSDLHFDLLRTREHARFGPFIEALKASEPDVLIIAGDTVGLGWSKLEECLMLFQGVARERMIVFGNHDHWSVERDTLGHLKRLEEIIVRCGFYLLAKGPKKIGSIGFAGNCGWYDYSFGTKDPPPESSYEKKQFRGRIVWNDALFVHLEKDDAQYSEEQIIQLERDIKKIEKEVSLVVAVTHHLGFAEMLVQKPGDASWNFKNAFMGSRELGEMLLRHPQVGFHFCGHAHAGTQIKSGHLQSVNVGSTYTLKRFLALDTETRKMSAPDGFSMGR